MIWAGCEQAARQSMPSTNRQPTPPARAEGQLLGQPQLYSYEERPDRSLPGHPDTPRAVQRNAEPLAQACLMSANQGSNILLTNL